jgi:serine/threonine protein kinase
MKRRMATIAPRHTKRRTVHPKTVLEKNKYTEINFIGTTHDGLLYDAIDEKGAPIFIKVYWHMSRMCNDYARETKIFKLIREAPPESTTVLMHDNKIITTSKFTIIVMPKLEMELFDYVSTGLVDSLIHGLNMSKNIVKCVKEFHSLGFAHLDICMENILVHENVLRLFDYGLAKKLGEPIYCPYHGRPNYKAPELIKYDEIISSPSLDVYSIGILIYTILTGVAMYSDLHDTHYNAIRRCKKLFPHKFITPNIEKLILEIISVNPSDRPSIDEIDRRLNSIIASVSDVSIVDLPDAQSTL